jgi:hypothetical protein
MAAASAETDFVIELGKPANERTWPKGAPFPGSDNWTIGWRPSAAQGNQRCPELAVHWNSPAAFLFGDPVFSFDALSDLAGRIQDHLPFQFGDLGGSESCSKGQEDDDAAS